MYTNIASPKLLFGWSLVAGLCPPAFTFSPTGTTSLLETPFKYAVWGALILTAVLLLSVKTGLSKKQTTGLAVLYTLVPLSFSFSANGAFALILNHAPLCAVFSWLIAGILWSKLLLNKNLDSTI